MSYSCLGDLSISAMPPIGSGGPSPSASLPPHLQALQVLQATRLAHMQHLTAPVTAAIDKAAPIISYEASVIQRGYAPNVTKLRAAKNDLERIKSGEPGYEGYGSAGLKILGAPSIGRVDRTEPAGRLFGSTVDKLDRWALVANDALIHAGSPTSSDESGDVWTYFYNLLQERTIAAGNTGLNVLQDPRKYFPSLPPASDWFSVLKWGGAAFLAIKLLEVLGGSRK